MKVNQVDPDTDEIKPIEYASLTDVQRFSRTKQTKDGPSPTDFKIDLSSSTSDWNKRAATIFADSFIASKRFNCTDHNAIRKQFLTHLKTVRLRAMEVNEEDYNQNKRDLQVHKARLMRRRNVCPSFQLSFLFLLILFQDIAPSPRSLRSVQGYSSVCSESSRYHVI